MSQMRNLGLILIVLLVSVMLLAINEAQPAKNHAAAQVVTGEEDHDISLADAVRLTDNFRKTVDAGTPLGGYFGRDAILRILSQEECVGIRYYYGQEDDGTSVLVLVGVNGNGEDMEEGELAERSWICPPFCDKKSALNGSATTAIAIQ